MQSHNTLLDVFIEPLNKTGVEYMVTGSVASICYGEPRMTHDIDLVIMLHEKEIRPLLLAFPVECFYTPSVEVVKVEMSRSTRGHFNIIHFKSALKADIYFTGNDSLQIWGIKNRQQVKVNDTSFWLAPAEYVIIKKLQYWEESQHQKHIDDIQAMLEVQEDAISTDIILDFLTSKNLQTKFKELLREN